MKTTLNLLAASMCAVSMCSFTATARESVDQSTIQKMTADWPNRPKLALNQMIAKYGEPQEVTSRTAVWREAGPFKRITLCSVETPHNFPKPHVDFLQHTIAMKVPADKASDLVAFDGSNSFSRTEGEISARCDSEAHNILTLNLIHDLLGGKITVAQAREQFDQNVADDFAGKNPPYMAELQFAPEGKSSVDPDMVTLSGAPQPMIKGKGSKTDSEVLCVVAAIDENEILAAEEAEKRKVGNAVMEYAKMMHTEHGKNIAEVMAIGKKIGEAPMETAKTDALRVKGAGELAAIVPLQGKAFAKAYIAMMVSGHTEALATIDKDLLKTAKNEAVKQFLVDTRAHVAMHLEAAKKIQASL